MSNDRAVRSIATPILAVLFIAIAIVVYWDTLSYTDSDSYVFPRAIALAMASLSIVSILRWLIAPLPEQITFEGANLRRLGLVAGMLCATLAMPWLGFLVSALLAYGIILILAMYDPWTPFRIIVYPAVGAAIVVCFYMLFKKVLLVPLPAGSLFGG